MYLSEHKINVLPTQAEYLSPPSSTYSEQVYKYSALWRFVIGGFEQNGNFRRLQEVRLALFNLWKSLPFRRIGSDQTVSHSLVENGADKHMKLPNGFR